MIARRAREIEPFLAVEVFQRAQALERAGADVIHLEYGEPDFETPSVIREAAEKALKDGGNKDHTVREFPGLNHLFQTCKTGAPSEYGIIEETIAPDVLNAVSEWIVKRFPPPAK